MRRGGVGKRRRWAVSPLDSEVELESVLRCQTGHNDATVQLHGVLDDGQSQTRATQCAAAPLVDTVEAFEDAVKVFGRNALAIVADTEVPVLLFFPGRDFYSRAIAGIEDGVVDEIAEDDVTDRPYFNHS